MKTMKKEGIFASSKVETKEKAVEKLSPNKLIKVRIWYPKINHKPTEQYKALIISGLGGDSANVGHASLETDKEYVSLWPHSSVNLTSAFKRYRAQYNTLGGDEYDEHSPCDLLICLYSLDVAAIEQAFDAIKNTPKGYVLSGNSSLAEEGGHSCCSIVYYLLREGGIEHLDVAESSSMNSIAITPENFSEYIIEAKRQEVILYPETANFDRLEGEYFPQPHQKCNIL